MPAFTMGTGNLGVGTGESSFEEARSLGTLLKLLACLSPDAMVLGRKQVRWRDSLWESECHLLAPDITTKCTGCSPEDFPVTGILLFIPVFSLDSQITFPQRFTVLKMIGKRTDSPTNVFSS